MGENSTKRQLRVFICHAQEDHNEVALLRDQLRAFGFDPWLKDLYTGMDWDMVIEKELRKTDAVIICLSDISVHKTGYVQHEIEEAIKLASYHPEGELFLLPIRLTDCEYPFKLKRWQYSNYYEQAGFEQLMMALNERANQVGARTNNYTGIGDLTIDFLIDKIKRTYYSANLLRKVCAKIDCGEIPTKILTEFNDHPYWLIRKISIEHIIKADSSKTLEFLFAFRNTKYFLSHELIRNYIYNRLNDNPLSIDEARVAVHLMKKLSTIDGISEATHNKDNKLYSKLVQILGDFEADVDMDILRELSNLYATAQGK